MANTNFVVHNGLTVGPTTIDAASGNITIEVTKAIYLGNLILRDNGDGQLHVRDITDNSDANIVATLAAISTTSGNIQIGTNHIESTNPNGVISLRPNGTGQLLFSSNTIDMGRGGEAVISTGGAYAAANIVLAPGTGKLIRSNAEIRTTANVTAAYYIGNGSGLTGIDSTAINNGTSNVKVISSGGNISISVNGTTNVVQVGEDSVTIVGNLRVNGTQTVFNTNNASFNDGLIYLADGNSGDSLDLGVVAAFTDAVRYQHAGLARDASDGVWKLFANVVPEPTTTINFTDAIYEPLLVGNLRVTDTVTAIQNVGTSGQGNIGATGATFNIVFAQATTAQYADLAEKYLADAAYAPGTVLCFGGEFEVTECNTDMCVRVAGVVSTQPGYVMNEGLTGENVVLLALTGRVPTRVTGPIRKGDMLVSNGDGRARAETLPRVGSVIGKALEDFDGEDSVIEVVIGKH